MIAGHTPVTSDAVMTDAVMTGVLGSPWRAMISPWGAITSGAGVLEWYVAADDRWYRPAEESSVRQTRLEGTPVVETRLRIPGGDAVQRVYSVADAGGLTVIEIDNESPNPIVVVFDRDDLLTTREPVSVPAAGLELSGGSTVVPIGHRASARVAIAHRRTNSSDRLPPRLPTADQVVRGWRSRADTAGRLDLPAGQARWSERIVAQRCDLLLGGVSIAATTGVELRDAATQVMAIGELVRLGEDVDDLLPDLVESIAVIGRADEQRSLSTVDRWYAATAFDSAERVLTATEEHRARRDLERIRHRLGRGGDQGPDLSISDTAESLDGIAFIPWAEQHAAYRGALLPLGLQPSWPGADFEVHGVPIGVSTAISYALRWHGARPAVLWEASGEPVTLSSPVIAPGWTSDAMSGEALWPPVDTVPSAGISFG